MLGEVPQPIGAAESMIEETAQYLKDSAKWNTVRNIFGGSQRHRPHLHGLSDNDQKSSILMGSIQECSSHLWFVEC